MTKNLWTRLGGAVRRPHIATGLAVLSGALIFLQTAYLDRHVRNKVEASDRYFMRATFEGRSRGFFVVDEAPVTRLRRLIPQIATRFETELPEVDFVRYQVERGYLEGNLFLFQSRSGERQVMTAAVSCFPDASAFGFVEFWRVRELMAAGRPAASALAARLRGVQA